MRTCSSFFLSHFFPTAAEGATAGPCGRRYGGSHRTELRTAEWRCTLALPPLPFPRTAALLACTAASRLCTACLDDAAPDALGEYPRASGLGAEHPIETPYFRPHGCEAVGQRDGTSFCGRKKKRRSTGTKVASTKLYGHRARGDAHHAGAAAEGGRVDWSGGAGWCGRAGDCRQFCCAAAAGEEEGVRMGVVLVDGGAEVGTRPLKAAAAGARR